MGPHSGVGKARALNTTEASPAAVATAAHDHVEHRRSQVDGDFQVRKKTVMKAAPTP